MNWTPIGSPSRVEARAERARRQAAEVLRSRAGHDEVAEAHLAAQMLAGLAHPRPRLSRDDRRQQHVAVAEGAAEAGTRALPVGGGRKVLLDRDLERRLDPAEDVAAVLGAPRRKEARAAVRVERLRALGHAEGRVDERRLGQRDLDEAGAAVLRGARRRLVDGAHVRGELDEVEVGTEPDDEAREAAVQLPRDVAERHVLARRVGIVDAGDRVRAGARRPPACAPSGPGGRASARAGRRPRR